VPVELTFGGSGIVEYNETMWTAAMSTVTGSSSDDVEVSEVKIFQTLAINGLSEGTLTAEYKASLIAAYLLEFPSLNASNIVFGDPVVSSTRRRRLGWGRRLAGNNFEIPVEIDASTVSPSDIASGLASDSFSESVASELANAGEDVIIQETKATGMELLFSVKAETTSDIEDSVVNNQHFSAEISAEALSTNLVEADAVVEADSDRVIIVTLAPTVEPTPTPTDAPTEFPTPVPTESPTPMPTSPPTESPTPTPTEVDCVPCDGAGNSARKLLFGDMPCCA